MDGLVIQAIANNAPSPPLSLWKISSYSLSAMPRPVSDSNDKLITSVAAPILAEGDLLGLVLFIGTAPGIATGDTEYKLAQTIAA